MTGDAWRPWRKVSPELLAYYVNEKAAAASVPDFWRLSSADCLDESIHDLR